MVPTYIVITKDEIPGVFLGTYRTDEQAHVMTEVD
jgi:hypothetical protein